ncbi:maleylpyruvate isomerase family mycothiol-dependent enzyme [Rhodococcus sp. 1168]|uniref:maleylpyruvate isomerase family mycothiol-dependent enzyme n=1 Tax=Rhodococcus sp. 1168 TaxID=2018041 RepID=UPI000A0D9EFE|nr:maleylpyruvate isomerase family mycothiol-dependent enzyme [Rhodococcus sp. 1168]ORI24044.1 hypothetical protein BJI47_16500 [Rhodococcus sp. 1168]
MSSDDEIFSAIAEERRALAATVWDLSSEQWATPSLCSEWTVKDVVAHLVVPLVTPVWRSGLTMVRARGNFHRANRLTARRAGRRYSARLPELLFRNAASRFTPPGKGPMAPLTDIVVHGHDIRRPLHIAHRITDERQVAVLDFITSAPSRGIFPTSDVTLHWKATDLDWTFGSGPIVQGPAASLMLVLTGRTSALADVTGPGVEHLAKSAE